MSPHVFLSLISNFKDIEFPLFTLFSRRRLCHVVEHLVKWRRIRLSLGVVSAVPHHRTRGSASGGYRPAVGSQGWCCKFPNKLTGVFSSISFRTKKFLHKYLLTFQLPQVVLSRQQAPGSEWSRVSSVVGSDVSAGVCSGSWHSVKARVHAARLSMSLDGGLPLQAAPHSALLEESDAVGNHEPLYLGGLPGKVFWLSLAVAFLDESDAVVNQEPLYLGLAYNVE